MPLFPGSPDDDTISGTSDADTLEGGGGNDVLDGGDGADIIEGQAGDDTINGYLGADTDDSIDGGEGDDEFSFFGPEIDITVDLANHSTSTGATLFNVENVWSDSGNDVLRGDALANRLRGWDGADTLEGGGGADTLLGEYADDTLAGGAGDDTLDGGDDADVAVFSGSMAQYNVTYRAASDDEPAYVTVEDTVAGRDGTDTIVFNGDDPTVEKLRFSGGVEVDTICFMPGTLVATPTGEVPVEALKRGELVLTADGRAAPVVWMGRQTVALRFADPVKVLPVRIAAGALGEGLPKRDLLVSPDHALLLDGVLVHAGALVNGSTIRREWDVPGRWTYWHVELADHALVLAEGVPAETFVDNAGRLAFDNWGEHQALYADGYGIAEMALPRAKSARQVPQALRERLAAAAAAAAPSVSTAA